MHAFESVIVASESLAFSLLKVNMSPSTSRPTRMYNDAFYSHKISCTLSHLVPFIGFPHRAGHGVAGLLSARFVRAAAFVVG